jgi:PAS domain S-box-containing protein
LTGPSTITPRGWSCACGIASVRPPGTAWGVAMKGSGSAKRSGTKLALVPDRPAVGNERSGAEPTKVPPPEPDQTGSDADQIAARRDAADAASDPQAAEQDQANADRQPPVVADEVPLETSEASRLAGDARTIRRRATTRVPRARSARSRNRTAADRDRIAADRDRIAADRDLTAGYRDESSEVILAATLEQVRVQAESDREDAAVDRADAAQDRADAALDRDRDEAERSTSDSKHDQLAAAIEQVGESIMIADLEARITYANPAFERITGYTRREVIGRNPRFLSSGHHSQSFYEAMWAALTSGAPWVGDFVNRRKDGSLCTEEAVITPIRNASGVVTSYVSVKRDVTHERALEGRAAQLARERAYIAATIRSMRAGDTPEATAQATCRQIVSLTGVSAAQLYVFELDGRAVPIGFVVPGRPDPPLRRLPYQRSRHLRERAAEGPWIEAWVNQPRHPYNRLLNELGVHSAAYAPVRYDGKLIGVNVIDAAASVGEAALSEALPALVEFADLAGAVIGRDVVERTSVRRGHDRIQAIIDRRAFHPVFQPIVELTGTTVVGYEALTRFDDRVAPDVRFAEATAVGLDSELEAATLRAALAAAKGLPARTWLNLNVSPEFILAREPLRTILRGSRRRLVLEVTEHKAIADYAAFLAEMGALGKGVDLAVDDAGAGFASLRHILELRPAFVKLDRWLIAGLESDEARQAMIAGMGHFATATGCRLIAEGIETEAELHVLRALRIPLGQGYLLGRPKPMDGAASSGRKTRRPHAPGNER